MTQEFRLPGHSVIAKGPSPGIRRGTRIIAKGEPVRKLQRILDHLGYGELLGPAGIDGKFGPDTEQTLRKFQRHHRDPQTGGEGETRAITDEEGRVVLGTRRGGELDDGIVGAKTERALNVALKTEVEVSSDEAFEPLGIPLSVGLLPSRKFKVKVREPPLLVIKIGSMTMKPDADVNYEIWANNRMIKRGSTKVGESGEIRFYGSSQDLHVIV